MLLADLGGVGAVCLEDSGWGKLTKPVAHHVFTDVNTDKIPAIMNLESMADKVWRDH